MPDGHGIEKARVVWERPTGPEQDSSRPEANGLSGEPYRTG